jgi:MerR family transcriptional regulator, copper efflux regulator
MKIQDFSKRTGVPAKTIRYYEEIGLLPAPARAENNYRQYTEQDIDRLRLVAGSRQLDLSLDDIREILAMRDNREAPCRTLLNRLEQKADEIKGRIRALQKLEWELRKLYSLGQTFPVDDVDGKNCVCHLVSERSNESITS